MTRRVVITGIGVISPIGKSYPEFSESLLGGLSGSAHITHFDASAMATRVAAEVKGFQLSDFVPPGAAGPYAEQCDRKFELGIAACEQAIQDGGYQACPVPSARVGSSFGTSLTYPTIDEIRDDLLPYTDAGGRFDGFRYVRESSPARLARQPRYLFDQVAVWLHDRVQAAGGSHVHFSACAASSQAIGHAFDRVRSGELDICFAGGYDALITPFGVEGFIRLRALTRRNDPPEKASRPFDRTRNGFLLGEGAAVVVLEEAESAAQNKRKIYGEIIGYGSSLDAHDVTAPHPESKGAVLSMQRALQDARIHPADVDYINAHGTGTPLNDPTETRAIRDVFGEHAAKLAVSSSKSMFGHLLAASGAIELVACAVALERQVLPPTINLEEPDPACDLDYVPNTAREADVRIAISNSFGFGGQNATLVVGGHAG